MQSLAHDLDAKERTKDVLLTDNVSFQSMLLRKEIIDGLVANGFRKPSPIQFKAVPLGRCGFDLIVKSKSGTGKTLVFSLIALETINTEKGHCQALILVPTREIAVQINDVLKSIGRFICDLKVEYFIGGLPVQDDISKAKNCHIAVGAPGRINHLIGIGALTTHFIRLFVLDEADKLMDSNFQSDINKIYNNLPQRKQVIAASATYPQELHIFLKNYMLSPTQVSSENETPLLLGLKQFVALITAPSYNIAQIMKTKNETLVKIFSKISFTQCLVFCNYQNRAESVSNYLNQKDWNSSYISGADPQIKRLEVVKNLKEFKNRILLSTDLTSRGIDAPNVDLVINYDLPSNAVEYLHRMGRAGRYGSSGICINLAAEGDELKQLQHILGAIGAANLSISKLPLLNENNDVLDLDPTKLEQIWAIVPAIGDVYLKNEDIKKGVLDLKQTNNKRCTEKVKNKKKRILKVEQLTKSSSVKNILISKEKDMEEMCEGFSKIDTENLLNSCLLGDSDEDNKKRKRISLEETNKGQKEKRKNDSKQLIFIKNRALLNITRLLHDTSFQVDLDVLNAVEEYLISLKEGEDFNSDHNINLADILVPSTNADINAKTDVDEEILEDIFKIGYDCAMNGENWLDSLPTSEIQRFQNFSREKDVISSDNEDNDEEDYEMDDCVDEDEILEDHVDQNHDVALQWVPVVSTEDESGPPSKQFTNCFDECSNVLWQTGLTFETTEAFDDWFYSWQEHLQSVRNYVQQNIYVEEMSKYQQSKLNGNN